MSISPVPSFGRCDALDRGQRGVLATEHHGQTGGSSMRPAASGGLVYSSKLLRVLEARVFQSSTIKFSRTS